MEREVREVVRDSLTRVLARVKWGGESVNAVTPRSAEGSG
jgi:hypothetical protein